MPFSFGSGTMPPSGAQEVDGLSVDAYNNIISQKTQIERVVVTSAQLLALKTTPLLLLPAPGLGLVILVDQILLKLPVYGGTAYTLNAGTLKVFQGTTANAVPLCADQSALLTAVVASEMYLPVVATGVQTVAKLDNVGIFQGNDGTPNYTLGNSAI